MNDYGNYDTGSNFNGYANNDFGNSGDDDNVGGNNYSNEGYSRTGNSDYSGGSDPLDITEYSDNGRQNNGNTNNLDIREYSNSSSGSINDNTAGNDDTVLPKIVIIGRRNSDGDESASTTDSQSMSWADQMKNALSFFGSTTWTVFKNMGLGATQGVIGLGSDILKGWGMIGDLALNDGRNISELEQLNLRPFPYDPGPGQVAGAVGEMISPAILLKGVKLAGTELRVLVPAGEGANSVSGTKGVGAFADETKLISHFEKHGAEFGTKSASEYLQVGQDIMQYGQKVEYLYKGETRTGFVQFMGNGTNGQSKFGFVGTNADGVITTIHTESGNSFWKMLNNGNIDKVIKTVP